VKLLLNPSTKWRVSRSSYLLTTASEQNCVGFDVRPPVVMKSCVFWDITPCSPLKVNRRFVGACRATYFHAGFLLSLFFDPGDGGDMCLRNVGWQRTTRRYIPEDRTLETNARSRNK
jgi:hypothetical protein